MNQIALHFASEPSQLQLLISVSTELNFSTKKFGAKINWVCSAKCYGSLRRYF